MRDQLEALSLAQESVRDADRRKDEFLALLAHELRNPLAPIRNAGELLARMMRSDSKAQGLAAIVKRQRSKLPRMVDELLTLHGGRVGAVSDGPGRGTSFKITSPLISRPQETRDRRSGQRRRTAAHPGRGRQC